MSTFFDRLARALESDEDRIARTSAEIEHEMLQRGHAKWSERVRDLERFIDSKASDLSVEDGLLEARRRMAFWNDAHHGLYSRSQANDNNVRARVATKILREMDRKKLRKNLEELARGLEETLGFASSDPLDEMRLEDFEILQRLAEGSGTGDVDQERHALLVKFSDSYQFVAGVHNRQTQNLNLGSNYLAALIPQRAQGLIREWEQRGFNSRKARRHLAILNGEQRDMPVPEPRLIRNPRDAEMVAVDWMRFWGFDDAEATPVGADEGIDVVSETAVAQVKAHMVPIGRPDLQNLAGVAAVEGKIALFFALNGYTAQAIQWANKAKMALFTFDLQGAPEPANDIARDYQTGSSAARVKVTSY